MHSQSETWYLEFSLTSKGLNLTETKIFSSCPFAFQCPGSSPPISPISHSPLFSSQIQPPIHSKTINRGSHDSVINKCKAPPPHSNPWNPINKSITVQNWIITSPNAVKNWLVWRNCRTSQTKCLLFLSTPKFKGAELLKGKKKKQNQIKKKFQILYL